MEEILNQEGQDRFSKTIANEPPNPRDSKQADMRSKKIPSESPIDPPLLAQSEARAALADPDITQDEVGIAMAKKNKAA